MTFDTRPSPAATLRAGQRVIVEPFGDYDGWDYHGKPSEGVILGYATPEIKERQAWTDESYYVRFVGDSPGGRGRVFDRSKLTPL